MEGIERGAGSKSFLTDHRLSAFRKLPLERFALGALPFLSLLDRHSFFEG